MIVFSQFSGPYLSQEGTMSEKLPSPDSPTSPNKVTTRTFQAKKQAGKRITMLTAYDYPLARAVDRSGIDSILVGDSLGMVVLGYPTTLPVTMEDMLHHCRAVSRGAERALLIGDMPFMSYQAAPEEAVRNAGRFLQEAGMDAVKLEGGKDRIEAVRAIISAGIPVLGHLGLTPQSVHQLGGFRAQGKTADQAVQLYRDALLLEEAGCFGLVLESVPDRVSEFISNQLDIPTIGIGAGGGCDGQVLVTHDLLGYFDRFVPKFVRQFASLHREIQSALDEFKGQVEKGEFPAQEHSFSISSQEFEAFLNQVAGG
jgi:3-methyl-2-oxobutanoate hydroxymethyltransferase